KYEYGNDEPRHALFRVVYLALRRVHIVHEPILVDGFDGNAPEHVLIRISEVHDLALSGKEPLERFWIAPYFFRYDEYLRHRAMIFGKELRRRVIRSCELETGLR